jgi:predicted DNA-binding transcriptional regulator AlpA
MQDVSPPASQPAAPASQSASQPTGSRIATGDECPKLIGYKQLRELYGWPKSTVLDWIRKRQFPKPAELPGREAQWFLDDILIWLDARRQGLVAAAVRSPDKLSPEDVERVARELAARHLARESASPVDPDKVVLARLERATEDEIAEAIESELERLEGMFSGLDKRQSLLVAAWLLPAYRPALLAALKRRGIELPTEHEALRRLAVEAMAKATGHEASDTQALPN